LGPKLIVTPAGLDAGNERNLAIRPEDRPDM